MKRRALALCAGLLLLGLMPGSALAGVGNLDLSNPQNGSGFYSDSSSWAQTFTADKTGLLSEVDLWMGYSYNPTGSHSVTVYIQTTDSSGAPSGAPATSPLTSAVGLVPADPAWVPFVFPTPIGIVSGTTYAIVFATGGANAIYDAGPYAGGKTWFYDVPWFGSNFQFAFQTWVIGAATVTPPTVTMAFGAASIPVGGTTSLTYTITNPNTVPTLDVRPAGFPTGTLSNIGFTDTLPAGLLIATPNNIGGSCGGAITATAGTNLVSITGLTLAAGATCGFGVDVIGVAPGNQVNTTGAITSTEGGTGLTATASITVTALSTPVPIATPTPVPTATPSQSVLAATAAPVRTSTPPPTSTGDSRGPGGESPLLPLLALAAVAALAATTFVLRSESRVHHR